MTVTQNKTIRASVGSQPHALNIRQDVELIQFLLNLHAQYAGYSPLVLNGVVSQSMIDAIRRFQKQVVGLPVTDGRVDPGGITFFKLLMLPGQTGSTHIPKYTGIYSHPDAHKVHLSYGIQGDGKQVVKLNDKSEYLLKSILASCGMTGAKLTSTLRTYHDQARITLEQTIVRKNGAATVQQWYGSDVLAACHKYKGDIAGMAKWWQAHDEARHTHCSKHITNHAMDIVPSGDRKKFVAKVQALKAQKGTGVQRIIPKGVMNEPVDHVEFTFTVTG